MYSFINRSCLDVLLFDVLVFRPYSRRDRHGIFHGLQLCRQYDPHHAGTDPASCMRALMAISDRSACDGDGRGEKAHAEQRQLGAPEKIWICTHGCGSVREAPMMVCCGAPAACDATGSCLHVVLAVSVRPRASKSGCKTVHLKLPACQNFFVFPHRRTPAEGK